MRPRHNHHVVSDDTEPGVVVERPDWHKHAACRGAGPALFYPDDKSAGFSARRVASRFCQVCPVVGECAVAGETEHHGVWGGLLQVRRTRARRRKAS